MSFNKLQNYKFNVSFTSDFITNNQMNSVLFFKDKNNNIIKNNNNFIIFENSSFLLKMFSNNIEINGKIFLEKSLKHLNENLNIKNIFEISNKIIFENKTNNLSIQIKQNNIQNLIRKLKIESNNIIKVNNENYYKSKNLIGQIINTINDIPLIQGKNGINIEIKENNNLKYHVIDYSALANTSLNKSSYFTKLIESDISFESDTDSLGNFCFFKQHASYRDTSTASEGSKRRYFTYFVINSNCKNWQTGKNLIYIDTSNLNNYIQLSTTDKYQMLIDLTGKNWQIGEEITFYLNLYNNLKTLNQGCFILPITNSAIYPAITYPELTVLNATQNLRKNMFYLYKNPNATQYSYLLPTSNISVNNDYIIISKDKSSNISASIKIYFSGTNINTNTDFKIYTSDIVLKYNSSTSRWEELTTDMSTFIKEKSGYFYNYQYIIKFPGNHQMFIDNSINNISSYFNLKNVVDTYTSSVIYETSTANSALVAPGNILPQNLQFFTNSINFDYSLNQSSFTFRFLGYSDPSRNNVGLWQIK